MEEAAWARVAGLSALLGSIPNSPASAALLEALEADDGAQAGLTAEQRAWKQKLEIKEQLAAEGNCRWTAAGAQHRRPRRRQLGQRPASAPAHRRRASVRPDAASQFPRLTEYQLAIEELQHGSVAPAVPEEPGHIVEMAVAHRQWAARKEAEQQRRQLSILQASPVRRAIRERRNAAAIELQRHVRQWQIGRWYKRQLREILVGSIWRKLSVLELWRRRKLVALERLSAVITIQRYWRGLLGRKVAQRQAAQTHRVVLIQALWLRIEERRQLAIDIARRRQAAATTMQSMWRGRTARRRIAAVCRGPLTGKAAVEARIRRANLGLPFDATDAECLEKEYQRKVEKRLREKSLRSGQDEDPSEQTGGDVQPLPLPPTTEHLEGRAGYYRLQFREWLGHWITKRRILNVQAADIEAALIASGVDDNYWRETLSNLSRDELVDLLNAICKVKAEALLADGNRSNCVFVSDEISRDVPQATSPRLKTAHPKLDLRKKAASASTTERTQVDSNEGEARGNHDRKALPRQIMTERAKVQQNGKVVRTEEALQCDAGAADRASDVQTEWETLEHEAASENAGRGKVLSMDALLVMRFSKRGSPAVHNQKRRWARRTAHGRLRQPSQSSTTTSNYEGANMDLESWHTSSAHAGASAVLWGKRLQERDRRRQRRGKQSHPKSIADDRLAAAMWAASAVGMYHADAASL
eukprot:SAG31_NODE_3836_length_3834_cov_8.054886_1_plen_700_part_00